MPGLQSVFSQAVEPNESNAMGNRVRPKKTTWEALANEESGEDTMEEKSEEGRAIKGQRAVYNRTKKSGTIT